MDLRFTFNEDVVNYDKMRPTYAKELYEAILNFSGLDSTKNALEIGIGTGQATLPFLHTGCKLTAVELGEDMARFSKEKFASFPNFHIINSSFEKVHLENDYYDLIYSATAFHWIPQEAGYPKVFNLLKSGGVVALFWNHAARVNDELDCAIQQVYRKYRPTHHSTVHRFSEEKCLEIAKTIQEYGFVDVDYHLYQQTRVFDAPQYMSLLNTYSDHRARQDEIRLGLESELTQVINDFGGKIDINDTMDLYLARKP
ncbi:SAM-dependent methyltransferase [Paenibacillus sp. 598K]|uniref:class I SAM-dependent methyltransferase n=1 Tax=Paenibacillus sp. 598K TaxID=1117987 RepID=UPI000FFA7D93|nr:class I SAM-dependent methyltransferase [Paenibacillus sp. 598K]GBF74384.1 SAM-dependent methyltransferase [Paenibacillus sp. 598K]